MMPLKGILTTSMLVLSVALPSHATRYFDGAMDKIYNESSDSDHNSYLEADNFRPSTEIKIEDLAVDAFQSARYIIQFGSPQDTDIVRVENTIRLLESLITPPNQDEVSEVEKAIAEHPDRKPVALLSKMKKVGDKVKMRVNSNYEFREILVVAFARLLEIYQQSNPDMVVKYLPGLQMVASHDWHDPIRVFAITAYSALEKDTEKRKAFLLERSENDGDLVFEGHYSRSGARYVYRPGLNEAGEQLFSGRTYVTNLQYDRTSRYDWGDFIPARTFENSPQRGNGRELKFKIEADLDFRFSQGEAQTKSELIADKQAAQALLLGNLDKEIAALESGDVNQIMNTQAYQPRNYGSLVDSSPACNSERDHNRSQTCIDEKVYTIQMLAPDILGTLKERRSSFEGEINSVRDNGVLGNTVSIARSDLLRVWAYNLANCTNQALCEMSIKDLHKEAIHQDIYFETYEGFGILE